MYSSNLHHTQSEEQSPRIASNQDLHIIPMQLYTIRKSIPDQFADLFTGLGTMKTQYILKLKPGTKTVEQTKGDEKQLSENVVAKIE